jgi:hypothetical protein
LTVYDRGVQFWFKAAFLEEAALSRGRLFQRDQKREEIKEAIKLEEERRAATVKNLYNLRALRLGRVAKQITKNRSGTLSFTAAETESRWGPIRSHHSSTVLLPSSG